MRKFFMTAFALSAMLVLASSSFALEKTTARMTDDSRADGWSAGASCTVQYYNFCTGWLWVLSGFAPSDQFGVCFDTCCGGPANLAASWHYVISGTPSGYGFTGTIAASAADANCCPSGAPIASQVFLPVTGWNAYAWAAAVPGQFVIHVTLGPSAIASPLAVATDHPGAGPTGPVACGTCYPVTRVNHSYYYGPAGACPGSVFFNDGVCDAQLLWDCDITACDISVEPSTWGSVKNLYR